MSEENKETPKEDVGEEKPFLQVIVHSFFIIPFLIAVFCVLLFASIHLLTSEKRSAYDYLEDVKTGGISKRWQGAFELSKILSNPEHTPKEERFSNELISAFESSEHDDNRIRQYLALAMGRTGDQRYLETLVQSLEGEKEENLAATLYALGMLKNKEVAPVLYQFVDHPNSRIRSIAIVALGSIANPDSIHIIKKGLHDAEANVTWGAAISLAQLGDDSGVDIIAKLLNREYLSQFPEVDQREANQLILTAIDSVRNLKNKKLKEQLVSLSHSDSNMNVRSQALKVLEKK